MCCAAAVLQLCCGCAAAVLRCLKPHVGGNLLFQRLQQWQNPEANTKECISRRPAKMNTAESFQWWSCCQPPPLFTFPPFVHFIDIHKCRMAQRLITHIETMMCSDVSQQTEGQMKQEAKFSVLRHASDQGCA